jgi:outer membrane murein-binding lipoprotein Lpp
MRVLGWLATALGVIGVAVCLVVAVGVWVVRPPVTNKTHEIAAIATDGLQKVSDLTDVAAARLTTVSESLGNITSLLDSVATSPLVDTAVGTKVRDLVSGFVEGPYASLHQDVAGLRERLTSISDVVRRLDAAIPGIELPGVVTDTIDSVDEKLTNLDTTVATVNQIAGNGVTTGQQVTALSTQVGQIQEVVDAIVPALGTAKAQVAEARTKVDHVSDQVDGWITLGALGGSIVFIYLALLNVLLYKQGRRWLAAAAAAAPTAPAATPQG